MTMPVRPDISASLAAGLTDKPRLELGQPDVIRPPVCADYDRLAALVIRAIDQEPAHASFAHLGERDLLRALHRSEEGIVQLGWDQYKWRR